MISRVFYSGRVPANLTWQRVQSKNNMHAVSRNGIVGDRSEVLLLVAVVQPRPRNIDPGSIGGGDSKGVDADSGELVDVSGGNEVGVMILENGAAGFFTDSLTEGPLVRDTRRASVGEEGGSQSVLDCQPSACRSETA